jgi:hypothetical protein
LKKRQAPILRFFAYTEDVPARTCIVSFVDRAGICHSVEVTAESLYEAVVVGIAEFRRCDLMERAVPGPGTTVRVSVKAPATEHHVSIASVRDWLAGVTRSPKERATKEQLRALLGDDESAVYRRGTCE